MLELRYYLAADGQSPFEKWFSCLDSMVAAKVVVALARLEQGNFSNVKTLGEGVHEYRIDWGPGYRIYFGRDGDVLVILLTGGSKKRQQKDIETAKASWADYKRRRGVNCGRRRWL
jgi:putative addiction module killer protein